MFCVEHFDAEYDEVTKERANRFLRSGVGKGHEIWDRGTMAASKGGAMGFREIIRTPLPIRRDREGERLVPLRFLGAVVPFGSRAGRDSTPDSDYDVALFLKGVDDLMPEFKPS